MTHIIFLCWQLVLFYTINWYQLISHCKIVLNEDFFVQTKSLFYISGNTKFSDDGVTRINESGRIIEHSKRESSFLESDMSLTLRPFGKA